MQAMTLTVPSSSHLVNNFVLTTNFCLVAIATKLLLCAGPPHHNPQLSVLSPFTAQMQADESLTKDARRMYFSFVVSFPVLFYSRCFIHFSFWVHLGSNDYGVLKYQIGDQRSLNVLFPW